MACGWCGLQDHSQAADCQLYQRVGHGIVAMAGPGLLEWLASVGLDFHIETRIQQTIMEAQAQLGQAWPVCGLPQQLEICGGLFGVKAVSLLVELYSRYTGTVAQATLEAQQDMAQYRNIMQCLRYRGRGPFEGSGSQAAVGGPTSPQPALQHQQPLQIGPAPQSPPFTLPLSVQKSLSARRPGTPPPTPSPSVTDLAALAADTNQLTRLVYGLAQRDPHVVGLLHNSFFQLTGSNPDTQAMCARLIDSGHTADSLLKAQTNVILASVYKALYGRGGSNLSKALLVAKILEWADSQ